MDTVYAHVYAWQRELAEAEMPIEGWKIHRGIGMSGGLFVAREVGRPLSSQEAEGFSGELERRVGAAPTHSLRRSDR